VNPLGFLFWRTHTPFFDGESPELPALVCLPLLPLIHDPSFLLPSPPVTPRFQPPPQPGTSRSFVSLPASLRAYGFALFPPSYDFQRYYSCNRLTLLLNSSLEMRRSLPSWGESFPFVDGGSSVAPGLMNTPLLNAAGALCTQALCIPTLLNARDVLRFFFVRSKCCCPAVCDRSSRYSVSAPSFFPDANHTFSRDGEPISLLTVTH